MDKCKQGHWMPHNSILLTLLAIVLICTAAVASQNQLFVIYTDNQLHDPPADRASVPVVQVVSGDTAWAGAVWVRPVDDFSYLSTCGYCIAWDVRPSDQFEQFLTQHSYRRINEEELP